MQLSLLAPDRRSPALENALRLLSDEGDEKERGAVFTSSEVVELMLDLAEYVHTAPLANLRLLEPSFGDGDFLLPAISRLMISYYSQGGTAQRAAAELADAITAVELHRLTYERTLGRVVQVLLDAGLSEGDARRLSGKWLICDDFLLADLGGEPFEFVIGNPPYVRQERIPKVLLEEYRARFKTLYDRADLYVPFFERGVDSLREGGVLAFICADRWLKNKYGGPLREKLGSSCALEVHIDMRRASAFREEVLSYPAITVLRRSESSSPTKVVAADGEDTPDLKSLARELKRAESGAYRELSEVANGRDPWLLDEPEVLALVRELEGKHPSLEEAGCRATIGLATGCDRVFIGPFDSLPVEPHRKIRLVTAKDVEGCQLEWGGMGLVNPFLENGALADLADFPKFSKYIRDHRDALAKRYLARKNPSNWYRTIDRVHNDLLVQPKLLIPDIKGGATVVLEEGGLYPHHNLYVVTSTRWHLEALQAVLRSSIAFMFVATYAIRMAGGFLRFQAQYLRRIRLPHWDTLDDGIVDALRAVRLGTQEEVDHVVNQLYSLEEDQVNLALDFAARNRVVSG